MEHITTRSSSTSTVSKHLKTNKHHFDANNVMVLAKEFKDFACKILEAIYIKQQKLALNRDKGLELDPVWDSILTS